jgi:hypothetical protein
MLVSHNYLYDTLVFASTGSFWHLPVVADRVEVCELRDLSPNSQVNGIYIAQSGAEQRSTDNQLPIIP